MSGEALRSHLANGNLEAAFQLIQTDPDGIPWEELGDFLEPDTEGATAADLDGVESFSPCDMEVVRALLQKLRYREAFSRLGSILRHSPRNTQALLLVAELSACAGNLRETEEYLQQVPEWDSSTEEVLTKHARLAIKQRRFAEAETCFCRLETLNAISPSLAVLRSVGSCADSLIEKFLEECLRTEGVPSGEEPFRESAHRLTFWESTIEAAAAAYAVPQVLGNLLAMAQGVDLKVLLAKLDNAGYLIPHEAFQIAADRLRESRNVPRAIELYRLVYEADPTDQRLAERLLRLEHQACEADPLRSRNEFEKVARASLLRRRDLLQQDPDSRENRLAYGRLLRLAGHHKEAIPILEGLTREYPNELAPMSELISLYQALRDADGTLEWSHRILSIDPSYELALLSASRALRAKTESQETVRITEPVSAPLSDRLYLEYLRNLFSAGEFERAYQVLSELPSNPALLLLRAATCVELGNLQEAESCLDTHAIEQSTSGELLLFRYLLAQRKSGVHNSLAFLNQYFERLGAQAIRINEHLGAHPFDQFTGTLRRTSDTSGPLISVIMTCFNVETFVRTAVRSIFEQSYPNLELLVVNDRSTDKTAEVLKQLQAEDSRLRIITNRENTGTYLSKNAALKEARGDYIAFQDSDDWSHPDRLQRCFQALESAPHLAALRTQWIRMNSEGEVAIRPLGNIADNCCISLFMRRAVLDRIGFFDSVRVDADIEYVHRLRLAFGQLPDLPWMLLFGRIREGALTSSGTFGMDRVGYNPFRRQYRDSYQEYHRAIVMGASPYLEFPLPERKFAAPPEMLS